MRARSALLALSLSLPAVATAQDADRDGFTNGADAYPCDADSAGIAFAPSENDHGTLMFEDRWPEAGDLDFNDIVLGYHYALRLDPRGAVRSMRVTLDAIALGGTLPYGLGLQLPVSRGSVASVTRVVDGGTAEPLTPSAADENLTLTVIPNMRGLFRSDAPVNSRNDQPLQPAHVIQLDITFVEPVALSAADAPYDVYVFRALDPSHEIHLPQFGGTAAMNTALFNSGDDASAEGRWFVETTGIPFALSFPTVVAYPLENERIERLYPSIVTFARSGGTSSTDFYRYPRSASVFVDSTGAGAPTPSAPQIGAADQSCLDACSESFATTCGATGCVTTVAPDGVQSALTPPAGQPAHFFSCAVSGQRWALTVSASSGCYDVLVSDTLGVTIASTFECGADILELPAFTRDGDVRIEMRPRTSGATVRVNTYNVPSDVLATMTPTALDTALVTTVPGQNARVLFQGQAGQRIAFQVRPSSGCFRQSMIGPENTTLLASNLSCGNAFSEVVTLTASGEHQIRLDPTGSTVMTLRVDAWIVADDTSSDTTVSGASQSVGFTTPGQRSTIRFEGSAGQRISMITDASGGCHYFSMLAPSGATVLGSTLRCGGGFTEPFVLGETGTYRVIIDPTGVDRPTVSVDLFDVPADPTIAIGIADAARSVATPAPGANATLTFEATAGQRIALRTDPTNGCFRKTLRSPSGTALYGPTLSCGTAFSDVLVLAASGTYSITLDPTNSDRTTMLADVIEVPADVTGTLVIGGGQLPLPIAVSGQNARATLVATAGQRINLAISVTGSGCLRATTVRSPSGTVAHSSGIRCGSGTVSNLTLSESGSYTIELDPNGVDRPTLGLTATLVP